MLHDVHKFPRHIDHIQSCTKEFTNIIENECEPLEYIFKLSYAFSLSTADTPYL